MAGIGQTQQQQKLSRALHDRHTISGQGRNPQEILDQLKQFGVHAPNFKDCRLWSLVYYLNDEYSEFLGQA